MQITIDTQNLSELDYKILSLLGDFANSPAEDVKTVAAPAEKPPVKKAAAKKKPEPEPEPEPDPAAEEPLPEEEVEEDEVEVDEDGDSDEDLLVLATQKATKMVEDGKAAKVREALNAAGANRVRELNTSNVREFFKALS